MTIYTTTDVPVRGGHLRVGIWDSVDVSAGAAVERVVLAVHGVTASHRSWSLVAPQVTDAGSTRFLAPDLRGRGRSAGLPGPYGTAQHAHDLAAVLDALGLDAVRRAEATVVGHSMGGFVAAVFAHLYPARISDLLLVDGGVPLPTPAGSTGSSDEERVAARLGPAAARLAMTFPSRTAYRDFWRRHPALGADWSEAIEDYVDYDLTGTEPDLRSSCSYAAVVEDSTLMESDGTVVQAWEALACPVRLLRAPLGLLNEPPGLYPPDALTAWQRRFPQFRWREVPGVNHYTITLGAAGANEVAAELDAIRFR